MGVGRDIVALRKNGDVVPVEIGLGSAGSDYGQMVIVTLVDISARKQAEEALALKARELARSNDDLSHFASIISHDLKEPARMIANFSELLRRDIRKLHIQDEQQLAQIGEWLSYTTDGATRLVRLVDDLLAYSRVKTGTMAFRQVDMNSALEVAKRNLQTILKDYPTAITAGDLPPAGGERSPVGE